MKYTFNNRFKWMLMTLSIVGLAFYISNNWYQLMLIQGNSMSPTYHNMQLTVINRHSKDYTYGNVVAFKCEGLSSVLVKRIVACPGDELKIEKGTLYVNGEMSSFYDMGEFEYAGIAKTTIVLNAGQYFVIGDNVAESKDSRYSQVGCVDVNDILGCLVF